MSHARIYTPASAADPIHTAITRHRAAFLAFHTAPEGDEALFADDDYTAASEALVSTACATRFGALALHDHLRWWLAEEAAFAAGYQPAYRLAQARAADLTLFLGTRASVAAIPRALPLGRLPQPCDRYRQNAPSALPNEPLPGEDEPWTAVMPVRPDTPHVRACRFIDVGADFLAAVAIIAGGSVLTGLATLI